LIKENAPVAVMYEGKSIAERNSIDVAFRLLMDDSFTALRNAIYSTEEELIHFHRIVVHAVLATDIVDPDLKTSRKDWWEKAYGDSSTNMTSANGGCDNTGTISQLRATIMIAFLVQASDVSHTMQHWHVYRQWNDCFFMECYDAYRSGRADMDPSTYWYKGEIGFFDHYIIPLACKLKECKLFGVSSDEYLDYALRNRQEWIEKGQEIVAEMSMKASQKERLEN
jgi:3'5'-cyclic nucleotide phosphodiesterase